MLLSALPCIALQDAVYCYTRCSVVCLLDMIPSFAKTAEPIEVPFGVETLVGPGRIVQDCNSHGDVGSRLKHWPQEPDFGGCGQLSVLL